MGENLNEQKRGLRRKKKPEPEGAGLSPTTTVLTTPEKKAGSVETRNLKEIFDLMTFFKELKKMVETFS